MKKTLLAFTLVLASITVLHSQPYPNRPLRSIVPITPGGGTDFERTMGGCL